MNLPGISRLLACFVPLVTIAAIGCGGTTTSTTPPPVEGIKPAPDAPFGGLGNPYNDQDKKAAPKKKG